MKCLLEGVEATTSVKEASVNELVFTAVVHALRAIGAKPITYASLASYLKESLRSASFLPNANFYSFRATLATLVKREFSVEKT